MDLKTNPYEVQSTVEDLPSQSSWPWLGWAFAAFSNAILVYSCLRGTIENDKAAIGLLAGLLVVFAGGCVAMILKPAGWKTINIGGFLLTGAFFWPVPHGLAGLFAMELASKASKQVSGRGGELGPAIYGTAGGFLVAVLAGCFVLCFCKVVGNLALYCRRCFSKHSTGREKGMRKRKGKRKGDAAH